MVINFVTSCFPIFVLYLFCSFCLFFIIIYNITGKPKTEIPVKRDPFIDLCNLGSNTTSQPPPPNQQPIGQTSGWNSGENSATGSRISSPVHRPLATPSPSHQPDYRLIFAHNNETVYIISNEIC